MPRARRRADFKWDEDNPLLPVVGEVPTANRALFDFYHLGSRRSLNKLLEKYIGMEEEPPCRHMSRLEDWFTAYDWMNRVAAQEIIDMRSEHEIWLERQREVRAADWEMGAKLRQLAVEQLEELGKGIITARNAAALIQLGTKLQRLAAGMPTETQKVDIDGRMTNQTFITQEIMQETTIRMDYEDLRKNLHALGLLSLEIANGEDHVANPGVFAVDNPD